MRCRDEKIIRKNRKGNRKGQRKKLLDNFIDNCCDMCFIPKFIYDNSKILIILILYF